MCVCVCVCVCVCARARALMCVYLRACVRHVFVWAHVCLRMRNPWNQICHFALKRNVLIQSAGKGIDDMHTERKLGAPAEKQNGKREILSECAMTNDLMYQSSRTVLRAQHDFRIRSNASPYICT